MAEGSEQVSTSGLVDTKQHRGATKRRQYSHWLCLGFAGSHGCCWGPPAREDARGVVNCSCEEPKWAKTTRDNGRFVMPLFITQGRFTHEYIRGGLAKPEDRHAVISRLIEQAGGKLVSLYI